MSASISYQRSGSGWSRRHVFFRVSWQLSGPDFHRAGDEKLTNTKKHYDITSRCHHHHHLLLCWAPERGSMSLTAASFSLNSTSHPKDHEVAASVHADTPDRNGSAASASDTPYTTPVDATGYRILLSRRFGPELVTFVPRRAQRFGMKVTRKISPIRARCGSPVWRCITGCLMGHRAREGNSRQAVSRSHDRDDATVPHDKLSTATATAEKDIAQALFRG